MRLRNLVCAVVVSVAVIPINAAPARAGCQEVGDPGCTVGSVVNASVCTAKAAVKNGANYKETMRNTADCFTQLH